MDNVYARQDDLTIEGIGGQLVSIAAVTRASDEHGFTTIITRATNRDKRFLGQNSRPCNLVVTKCGISAAYMGTAQPVDETTDVLVRYPEQLDVPASVHSALQYIAGDYASQNARTVLLKALAIALNLSKLDINMVNVNNEWHVIAAFTKSSGESGTKVGTHSELNLPSCYRMFSECLPLGCVIRPDAIHLGRIEEIIDCGTDLSTYMALYPSLVEALTRNSEIVLKYRTLPFIPTIYNSPGSKW